MRLFRRKPKASTPEPISLVNVVIDRVPEIRVRHEIERKPVPKPMGAKLVFRLPDGREIHNYFTVDWGWRTVDFQIPKGVSDFYLEWDRKPS